jgi:CxxC-x17-CxxC domain-containing protein
MHSAECSKCHKACQVPFRPNGTKPVFCADCFTRDGDRDSHDSRGSFQKREYGAPRSAPTEDRRIDELKRQLIQMDSKLDRIVQMIDAANHAPAAAPAKEKAAPKAEAPAKAKKAVVKKAKASKKA